MQSLSLQSKSENLEMDVSALLERLESHSFLEKQADTHPDSVSREVRTDNTRDQPFSPVTLRQQIVGASHSICVLNELRQQGDGLYRAYQYIQKLKATMTFLSPEAALRVVREEYWVYRIVTGLLERRVAHLLGQAPGEEGLCMVRAFAFCGYFLTLNVPAQIIIGRPMYGSRNGFKLHVWVEMQGKPLNERPNVRDAYRVMAEFPF